MPVVSIDIPSGLDSDSGAVHGVAVRASLTVTMGLPKLGLLQGAAVDQVGRIEVVDLGFPADQVAALDSPAELITAADIRPLFPPRTRGTHTILSLHGDAVMSYDDRKGWRSFAAPLGDDVLSALFIPRNCYRGEFLHDGEDHYPIALVERETPSAGRKLGLLEQLFGNIGRFSGDSGSE